VSTDLYPVKFIVGDQKLPGAPLLHVSALVDAASGKITGKARITQAVTPPAGDIEIHGLTGQLNRVPLVMKYERTVALKGHYQASPITPLEVGFSADLQLELVEWTGVGSFTYGAHKVKNVPVRRVGAALPKAA
jgi:hypothetical protein